MLVTLRATPTVQTTNNDSYFGVFGEDVIHQAFVPGPEWPTAATHSCNTEAKTEKGKKSEKVTRHQP